MKEFGRFHAFSDGVFAILITILVLEFRMPSFTHGHLASALLAQWLIFLSYVMAYLYVGTLWLFHHDYFSHLTRVSRQLNMLNLLLLFSITFVDYPLYILSAALQSGRVADLQVAMILYVLVAMFVSFIFLIMYQYVGRHNELHDNQIKLGVFDEIKHDPAKSVSIYGLVIITTFWSVYVSAALIVAGIVFHFIAYLRMSSRLEKAENAARKLKEKGGGSAKIREN